MAEIYGGNPVSVPKPASDAPAAQHYPFTKVGEIVLGAGDLAYAFFTLIFWTGAIILILILPSDGVRSKISEMDKKFAAELDSIKASYKLSVMTARTGAERERALREMEDALSSLPLMDRMPVYETFTSPGVYWPMIVFAIISFLGNLLLAGVSIARIMRRPWAIKWLRIVWYVKTLALLFGVALFLLFARGPLNSMFANINSELSAIYSGAGSFVPEAMEMMWRGFWFGLFIFAVLMMIWPVSTFIFLLFYRKKTASPAAPIANAPVSGSNPSAPDLH